MDTAVETIEAETGEDRPKPDLDELARALMNPLGVRSLALTGLFILACFYTLYFGREFFLPIMLAFVFTFLLSPIVRALRKLKIPEYLGAAIVILALFAAVGALAYELSSPFTDWLRRVPEIARKLEQHVQHFKTPVEQVTKAENQMEQLANLRPAGKRAQPVELQQPSLVNGLFSRTWNFLFQLALVVILLYFLLASGDLFLRKLIHVLPRFQDKKKAVQIARQIEDHVSTYLLTIAVINAALGTAAALVFWALGMPNPWLWGALAGLFNFIPYLGSLTIIAITGLVASATFPSIGHALLVPAAYFGLATLEGNFLTPMIVGRRLTLNAVVIFLGLTFWGWLWGIPGGLLAVPMLVMFKIFCDHIEPLAPIGEFLGN